MKSSRNWLLLANKCIELQKNSSYEYIGFVFLNQSTSNWVIPSMPCNQIHQTSKMSKIYLHMNLWTYKHLNHKIKLSNQITYKFPTPKHKFDMSKIWIIHEIPNHITHTMSTTFLMKPRIDFKSKTKLIVIK
jgi:hypothetical protein